MSGAVIKSTRMLKKELPNNVRLSEFVCDLCLNQDSPSPLVIVVPVSNELKLEWVLTLRNNVVRSNPPSFRWEGKLKLDQCNKNVFGTYVIRSSASKSVFRGEFNANFIPHERSLGFVNESDEIAVTMTLTVYQNMSIPLFGDYDKLLENQEYCDIVFVVGDEEVPAHKLIVSARCDVFARMFYSDMIENKTGRAEIVDIEPEIFKQLLRFIYSGKVATVDIDELLKLIQAANKYSVRDLVDMCAYRLSCKLCVSNAVDILIVADRINVDFLKEECIKMVVNNKGTFVDLENYQNLRKHHPDLALQILDSIMEKSKKEEQDCGFMTPSRPPNSVPTVRMIRAHNP